MTFGRYDCPIDTREPFYHILRGEDISETKHRVARGSDGELCIWSVLYKRLTISEAYELEKFPFDRQYLNLVMNTPRTKWNYEVRPPAWMPQSHFESTNWDYCLNVNLGQTLYSQYEMYSPLVCYNNEPKMKVQLRVERKVGYYMQQIYFPIFYH
eukprot:UN33898